MAEGKSNGSGGGVGVLGLLGTAFVVLKITGHVKWSWLWVTAPFWGVTALVAVVVLGALTLDLVDNWIAARKRRNREWKGKL